MSHLVSEESTVQSRYQEEQGLKMLTPDQMLTRLPINLV